MQHRRIGVSAIALPLLVVAVACGVGDSDEAIGVTPTPELTELVAPLVVDTAPQVIPTQTSITVVPTVDPVAELFSINELVCLQTELGGNVSAISSALDGTSALSLQTLRLLQVCTGSSIVPGEAPEFSVEQIDCLIERGEVETLQNLSPEETQALGRAFIECGIIEFDPLAVEPSPESDQMVVDIAPTTVPPSPDPLGTLPSFFAHSDPDCVAERAGQSTIRLVRKATDIRSLEYQVGIASFCLDSSSRSIQNYIAPTSVPEVTVCQNAFLGLQALINSEIENPLLLTLGLSQVNSKCEFDEVRLFVFSG
jgi:hypothetical protein